MINRIIVTSNKERLMDAIDTNQDDEKRKKFLIKLAFEFHENHYKKVGNSVTAASLLITANGVLLIAIFNLFQLLLNDVNFNLGVHTLIITFCLLLVTVFSSIILSLVYIHEVNPLPFDLSPISNFLKTGTYSELLDVSYDFINKYTIINRNRFDNLQKYLNFAEISFGMSIGIISAIFLTHMLNFQ